MPCTYDYAVVRVVPRVERGEFINVGIIVWCQAQDFLAATIEFDESRVRALNEALDMERLREHLAVLPRICAGGPDAGPIGLLPASQRFGWLVAPRSTVVQTSAVHTGRTADLLVTMDAMLERLVRVPRSLS